MAPRKEKAEKKNPDDAILGNALVLDYLKKQNRPYSAIDISANLHNKVTKPAAVKILKDLQDQNLISGKTAGKAIVYHAIQDPNDSATPEEIAAMDAKIATLRSEIADLKSTEKNLKQQLTTLNATMSTCDLITAFQMNHLDIQEIEARLGPLRAGEVRPVSKEEKERVEGEWRVWSRRAGVRKKIALEVWGLVSEEMPEGKTREELWEELGLEGDE